MHLFPSPNLLPSYAACITPPSLEQLLRGYLLVSLGWWVSRGRPNLDIEAFYFHEATSLHPTHSIPLHRQANELFVPRQIPPKLPRRTSGGFRPRRRAWYCTLHPDDDVSTTQRTLSGYGSLPGSREAGRADLGGQGFQARRSGKLDGSLFIPIVVWTATGMGRVTKLLMTSTIRGFQGAEEFNRL
ncbi:hypothetical protein FPV67DRAFT_462373 [Lyophyllum atratum]|nr:hypothetical protein FPV67DRAFT_462373 [Lyophyllum atratum]